MKKEKIEFDLYSIINIKSLKFHFIVMEIDAYKRQDKEHENHWFFEEKK